jgi:hypothetical protein
MRLLVLLIATSKQLSRQQPSTMKTITGKATYVRLSGHTQASDFSGGLVKRLTKAAIGGLAGCALALGITGVASGALSEIYKFREALTDFMTADTGPFDSARAKTTIRETADGGTAFTTFAVRVTGIDPLVAGRTFGGHLHIGPCDTATNMGHYRANPAGDPSPPNELWFDFTPDDDGMAYDVQTAPWVPVDHDGQMSIVVHVGTADLPTSQSPKQACFPLEVPQWDPTPGTP